MIADALAGKIDLIVTKSVSRFARNTVDSLTTIRKLKERGVEVFFEKENISTLDSKGELLLTIMSSLAQEESRSISENVTWGQRKRFADGKVSMPYKHFLGYRKGENGEPEILEDEAIIVRRIYRLFLEGKTPSGIAEILTKDHVPTPAGKSTWQPSTIQSILTNEKYKGDALLQKSFCVDFLIAKQTFHHGVRLEEVGVECFAVQGFRRNRRTVQREGVSTVESRRCVEFQVFGRGVLGSQPVNRTALGVVTLQDASRIHISRTKARPFLLISGRVFDGEDYAVYLVSASFAQHIA